MTTESTTTDPTTTDPTTTDPTTRDPAPLTPMQVPPPSEHQLALMIWLAVLPTLTALNLALSTLLRDTPTVLRTFVLATVAVPIVMYVLMPRLHRLRIQLMARRTAAAARTDRRP